MAANTNILIADDDPVSLALLGKLIEKLNYHPVMATNGQEAWNKVLQQPIDLIVSDFEMPGLNGLELLKKVKGDYPHLPFILVTAYSNIEVIRDAWESGAFDFFQKPVFVDRLNQVIRLAIEYGHLSIARRRFPKSEEHQPDPDLINLGVVRELAVALERDDLMQIVEEFETHARIELEQILRNSIAKNHLQVRALAHRLAGTSINLGLVKVSNAMRSIEDRPEAQIANPLELEKTLEQSIYWLRVNLSQIFQSVAV